MISGYESKFFEFCDDSVMLGWSGLIGNMVVILFS